MDKLKDCYKYKNEIEWTVPGLFIFDPSWKYMHDIFKEGKIKFPSANYYGAPRSAWTAGRGSWARNEMSENTIRKVLRYIKNIGSVPTYTFTRHKMTKEYLDNKYANMLLDIGLQEGARFIVSSDDLKNKIKEKNPSSIVVSSILKPIFEFQQPNNIGRVSFEQETKYYNELLKEYDVYKDKIIYQIVRNEEI